MYLKKLELHNIKCFENVELVFRSQDGNFGGWNVVLGQNGRGKSTILRCIAMSVLNAAEIAVALERMEGDFIRRDGVGRSWLKSGWVLNENTHYYRNFDFLANGSPKVELTSKLFVDREGTLQQSLCFGYGPFRRLDVSQRAVPNAFQIPQPLSRFTTLFTNDIGLADATRGLIDLYVASLDRHHSAHRVAKANLEPMTQVVNALLPTGIMLDSVTSESVLFKTASGVLLREQELSDGYRSFLALVFDLLRHLAFRFESRFSEMIREEDGRVVVDVEAIVLIDEADAHLHPAWQRELGMRLRQVFPNVQFIVTTHSPFIAQEATDSGLFVLRAEENGSVTVEQPVESVRRWTASQILTSPLFGLESTRDPETESLIRENATLIRKERAGQLSPLDKKRLAMLKKQLALTAPGETYEEMQRQQEMTDFVDRTLNRLTNGKQ